MVKCLNLERALKNFMGLSDIEAGLVIKIIERTKVTVKDVNKILKDIGAKKSSSRAYQLLTTLVSKDMINEDKEAKPKTFVAVHPRVLLNMIEENKENIRKEILQLEQAQELFVPEEEKSGFLKTFKNINEIETNIYRLCGSNYKIKLVLQRDEKLDRLFNRLGDGVNINPQKSDINAILLENTELNQKVILFLNLQTNPSGEDYIIGSLQTNERLFDYLLKKEVK